MLHSLALVKVAHRFLIRPPSSVGAGCVSWAGYGRDLGADEGQGRNSGCRGVLSFSLALGWVSWPRRFGGAAFAVVTCPQFPHTAKYDFIDAERGKGMSKSNHSEAQMIGALKQLEAGRTAEDIGRELGVSKHTIYAWKAKYGGMTARMDR
jgi:hypothetical protein